MLKASTSVAFVIFAATFIALTSSQGRRTELWNICEIICFSDWPCFDNVPYPFPPEDADCVRDFAQCTWDCIIAGPDGGNDMKNGLNETEGHNETVVDDALETEEKNNANAVHADKAEVYYTNETEVYYTNETEVYYTNETEVYYTNETEVYYTNETEYYYVDEGDEDGGDGGSKKK